MATITLLGDSVIDNGAYIAPGEPDVASQIAARLPGWTVEMRAVDGNVASDVMAALGDLPAGPVFLSAGGNDALSAMPMVSNPDPLMTAYAFAHVLAALGEVREAFRRDYTAVLDALAGRPVLAATIYNPAFTADEARYQAAAEAGLSAFNDVISQEALARGMSLIDLRNLFDDAADYANPIEPSAVGGAKIAEKVAAWCRVAAG